MARSPYIVRLFPMPTAAAKIRVERLSLPTLITMADLSTAAQLTLIESQVVATLIPLIKDQIAASSIASPTLNVAKVGEHAERVRETLPYTQNPVSPHGCVRTQPGF